MKKTMLFEFSWDDELGETWFNDEALSLLLYDRLHTEPRLLDFKQVPNARILYESYKLMASYLASFDEMKRNADYWVNRIHNEVQARRDLVEGKDPDDPTDLVAPDKTPEDENPNCCDTTRAEACCDCPQEDCYPCCDEGAPLNWDQLSLEAKVERMREIVKEIRSSQGYHANEIYEMRNHCHGPDGAPLVRPGIRVINHHSHGPDAYF